MPKHSFSGPINAFHYDGTDGVVSYDAGGVNFLASAMPGYDEANIWCVDCGGGGVNITLPDEATWKGKTIMLVNASDAAEVLTPLGSAGGAILPGVVGGAVVLAQDTCGFLYCNGTAWRLATGAITTS